MAIQKKINNKFGNKVEVTLESTPTVTGFLEVSIPSTGQLLHSKKNGDGYVNTTAKMQKIVDAVRDALAGTRAPAAAAKPAKA